MAVTISDECVGCGACVDTCPTGALEIGVEGKAVVNESECVECGACVATCPAGAKEL